MSDFIATTIIQTAVVKPSNSVVSTFGIFSNLTKHLLHDQVGTVSAKNVGLSPEIIDEEINSKLAILEKVNSEIFISNALLTLDRDIKRYLSFYLSFFSFFSNFSFFLPSPFFFFNSFINLFLESKESLKFYQNLFQMWIFLGPTLLLAI